MWSGPEAATIRSVPPETGFPLEAEEDELLLDDPPHAASPAAARATAASAANRLG